MFEIENQAMAYILSISFKGAAKKGYNFWDEKISSSKFLIDKPNIIWEPIANI